MVVGIIFTFRLQLQLFIKQEFSKDQQKCSVTKAGCIQLSGVICILYYFYSVCCFSFMLVKFTAHMRSCSQTHICMHIDFPQWELAFRYFYHHDICFYS